MTTRDNIALKAARVIQDAVNDDPRTLDDQIALAGLIASQYNNRTANGTPGIVDPERDFSPPARLCQRGVDGSPGCGHHFSFFVDGKCHWKRTRAANEICGHKCNFTEPVTAQETCPHSYLVQHCDYCSGRKSQPVEVAAPRQYAMIGTAHPESVVDWFLELKRHWFETPSNLFYGQRKEARAYLDTWIKTGEFAPDNTALEIQLRGKLEEWITSSWRAVEAQPAPPIQSERHEFTQSYVLLGPLVVEGVRVCNLPINGTPCGQPATAQVHGRGPECPEDCAFCSGEACELCGAGCWSNVRNCFHDVSERHIVKSSPAEVPEKLFVQFYTNTISATTLDPREVHDNGKPVYRFVRSDLALERAVEIVEAKRDEWTRRKDAVSSQSVIENINVAIHAADEIIAELKREGGDAK